MLFEIPSGILSSFPLLLQKGTAVTYLFKTSRTTVTCKFKKKKANTFTPYDPSKAK